MTGNVQELATHQVTMYKPIAGDYVQAVYDPLTGNTKISDVVPMWKMETLFNLDNHLQFHDYVIRSTETDKPTVDYFKEHYGISSEASSVSDVLDKIRELHGDPKDPNGGDIQMLIDGIKQNMPRLLLEPTVRFASAPEDFARLRLTQRENSDYAKYAKEKAGGQGIADRYSPAIWRHEQQEILLNPVQAARYDSIGAAKLILHEVIHSGTLDAIHLHEQWKLLGKDTDALLELNKQNGWTKATLTSMLHPVERLDEIYQHLQSKKFYPGAYGMVNLHEFASEAMTNRMFQIKLSLHDLPDNLTASGRLKSAWDGIKHWFGNMFVPTTGKDAFGASTKAIESILRVADAHMFAPTDDAVDPRAPMTEDESDKLVKADYEYQYALHNSWIDLVNNQIAPLAKKVGVPLLITSNASLA